MQTDDVLIPNAHNVTFVYYYQNLSISNQKFQTTGSLETYRNEE